MKTIAEHIKDIRQQIIIAEQRYQRQPNSVEFIGVSKKQPPERIKLAFDAGVKAFGENYLQEALPKIKALTQHNIQWHFIGPIQSNKTQDIATHFHWAHCIDRLKIAERLAAQRPSLLPPLNICIQMNLDKETSKSGLENCDEAWLLAQAVSQLPNLRLRGLMSIPKAADDFLSQHQAFAKIRNCFENLCARGLKLDTLSMGMSHDFEAAIAEGATLLRLGTAIFGERR